MMNDESKTSWLNSSFIIHHSSLVKNSLAHVALRAVGEERDDALACAEPFGDLSGRRGGGAGGAAAEDAFGAREFADGGERLGVRNCDDLVGHVAVEVRGDELALADAFEPVRA